VLRQIRKSSAKQWERAGCFAYRDKGVWRKSPGRVRPRLREGRKRNSCVPEEGLIGGTQHKISKTKSKSIHGSEGSFLKNIGKGEGGKKRKVLHHAICKPQSRTGPHYIKKKKKKTEERRAR